jgi:hypothetical protein
MNQSLYPNSRTGNNQSSLPKLSGKRPHARALDRGERVPPIAVRRGGRWLTLDVDVWRRPSRPMKLSPRHQQAIERALERAGRLRGFGYVGSSGCLAKVIPAHGQSVISQLEAILLDAMVEATEEANDAETEAEADRAIKRLWRESADGFNAAVRRAEVEDLERLLRL